MSTAKQKGKFKPSRKVIISTATVVGVLLVAFAVGMVISWLQHGNNGNNANVTGLPTTPLPNSIVAAQSLAAQGKYDQAQQSITNSIAATTDKSEKYDLYLEQGVTYENQQNYTAAIDAYTHANTVKPTVGAYEAIGRVAEMLGNKQLAIDSYSKELLLLTKTDERTTSLKQTLETKIQELKG